MSSLWVFCPPVSLRDDVYGPLGSQEGTEGEVGLREADEGLLQWNTHTQPPAQCCWCLEPGITVCAHSLVRWYTPFARHSSLLLENWVVALFVSLYVVLCHFCHSLLFCLSFFSPGKINTSSSSSFSPPPPQSPKTQLMSSSFVLRMADFSIYQVATNTLD